MKKIIFFATLSIIMFFNTNSASATEVKKEELSTKEKLEFATEEKTTETINKVETFESNNEYFPNMTMQEVSKWYVEQINACINNGISINNVSIKVLAGKENEYEVEDFAECVNSFMEDYLNEDKYLSTTYMSYVLSFKSEKPELIKTQLQMFGFIMWYIDTYKYTPNTYFQNYIDVLNGVEVTTENVGGNGNVVQDEESTTTTDEKTIKESIKNSKDVSETEKITSDTKMDRVVDMLKMVGFSIVILIGIVLIGGIVYLIKIRK